MLTNMLTYYQNVFLMNQLVAATIKALFTLFGNKIINVALTIKTCVFYYLLLKQCSVESASLSFQQQPSPPQVVSLTSPHDCLTCAGIWEQFRSA